jgi:hypothetical protein
MAALPHFVGTWRNAPHDPQSTHTLIWKLDSTGLRGRWIVEPTIDAGALIGGKPRAYEMRIGRCWIEDDVLLFHVNGNAWPSEFRQVATRSSASPAKNSAARSKGTACGSSGHSATD